MLPDSLGDVRSLRQLRAAWRPLLHWIVILGGLLAYNGLVALALILVARRVPPESYGQFAASLALAGFLVVLPGFGIDSWLLTQAHRNHADSLALWWSAMRARLPLLAVWALTMFALTVWLPADTYPTSIWWPVVISMALDSVAILCFATLRTQNRHWQVTALQAAYSVVLLALAVLLPVSVDYLYQFAAGRSFISLLAAVTAVLLLAPGYRSGAALMPVRRILSASRSFMTADLSSAVYVRADLTIVSFAQGSGGVGIYGPAINLLQFAFLPLRALFFFVVPVLSRAYQEMHHRVFLRQGAVQGVAQALGGMTLSLILFLFAPQIVLLIFGEQYAASAEILRILSPIPFLRGLNFALAALLTSSERQRLRTRVQLVVALFNVIANLLVIRPYGLPGVAVVYVLSELWLCLGYGYLTARGWRALRPRVA